MPSRKPVTRPATPATVEEAEIIMTEGTVRWHIENDCDETAEQRDAEPSRQKLETNLAPSRAYNVVAANS